jgi:RNA polymerase sigma-32 factor
VNDEGVIMQRQREEMNTGSENDPLKLYFAEISKYPILTAEEERRLAELIQNHDDKKAVEKLIMSNLRLVVKVALNYYNAYLNVLDLIQEGNVGLIHAAKKYDPNKGTRFSTYASFWIRAYILKHIMNVWSIVKIGTTQSQRKLFYSLNKTKKQFEGQGIEPGAAMLAEALDVKEADIEDMEIRFSSGDVSLDESTDRGGETSSYLEMVRGGDNIEEMVAAKEKREMLEDKIREFKIKLNYRDRFILENRIMSDDPLTLQEIGKRFSISRERVRQVEDRIWKSLRRELKRTVLAREAFVQPVPERVLAAG